jgi:hypothetical protein
VLTYHKRFDLYFYLRKIDKMEKRTDAQ